MQDIRCLYCSGEPSFRLLEVTSALNSLEQKRMETLMLLVEKGGEQDDEWKGREMSSPLPPVIIEVVE